MVSHSNPYTPHAYRLLPLASGLAYPLAWLPDPSNPTNRPGGPQLLAVTGSRWWPPGDGWLLVFPIGLRYHFGSSSYRPDGPTQQPAVAKGDPVNGTRTRMPFTG